MSKTVCIIQSSYIPWRGYFDLLGLSDEFIVYDTVQYTRRDWRSRNRIKAEQGSIWLTVPVANKGQRGLAIDEVPIANRIWAAKHWKTLRHAYRRAPCFDEYGDRLEALYDRSSHIEKLSQLNRLWIDFIVETLGLQTRISSASDFDVAGDRNDRLIALCTAAGATRYLSGPAARSYLDESAFKREGIEVEFMDYEGYPEYPQLHGAFDPFVSILDLILNVGASAPDYMKFANGKP